jgi:transposase
VLEPIATMTVKIKHYDRLIQQLTETEYPETQALIKVYGVGQLTALTYVLTLGSKERFERSRDVGCYLDLRPRRRQSGDHDSQLGITKAGNIYLRSLLVECANHVLGPHGRDSTLRQWGMHGAFALSPFLLVGFDVLYETNTVPSSFISIPDADSPSGQLNSGSGLAAQLFD